MLWASEFFSITLLLVRCRLRSRQAVVSINSMNDDAQPNELQQKLDATYRLLANAEESLAQARNQLEDLNQPSPQPPLYPTTPDGQTTLDLASHSPILPHVVHPQPNPAATTFPVTNPPDPNQPLSAQDSHQTVTAGGLPQNALIGTLRTTTPEAPRPLHQPPVNQIPPQFSHQPHGTYPGSPPAMGYPMTASPPPRRILSTQQATPKAPWWTNEQVIIRLVGFFGAAVTFAGITFLVSLGIERGILGPTSRVVLAGVLGIILLLGAVAMRRRNFHPVAIGAAFTTSLLVLGATDIALGFITNLWPALVATICLLLLLIGYMAITYRWRSENLAIAASISGFALLLWHLYYDFEPHLFPYSIAGLLLMTVAYLHVQKDAPTWKNAEIIAAVLTIASALAGDLSASTGYNIGFWLLAAMLSTIILKAHISVPILLAVMTLSFSTPETFVLLIAVCVIWILLHGGTTPLVMLPVVFIPLSSSLVSSERFWAFVGFYLTVAVVMLYFRQSPPKPAVWIVWLICGVLNSSQMAIQVIFTDPSFPPLLNGICSAGAITIMLLCVFFNRATVTALPKPIPLITALIGMHFSMLVVVTITTLLAPDYGNLLGHALTSISWIILAAVLLIGRKVSMGMGVTLTIAAITKLVLYDMAALSGLPRVSAFLFSGLILIIIAVLRGKTAQPQTSVQPKNIPPTTTHNAASTNAASTNADL